MKSVVALFALFALTAASRPQLDGRIVGGVPTTIEDLPYQLSLQSYGSHICGASRISDTWALTAAHCAVAGSASSFTLRAASSTRGSGGSVHQVSKVIVNPKYNPNTMTHDYALMKVSTPFPNSAGSQNVRLASAGSDPSAGTMAVVSGWGTLSSGGSLPRQLQRVDVPIVSRASCAAANGNIDASMICAGYEAGGKDSCQGDSGGPLVSNGVQIGVVSWGYGCAAPHYPGVYSNVGLADARNWIMSNTGV